MSAEAVQDVLLAIGAAWGLYLLLSALHDIRQQRRRRPWWRAESDYRRRWR